MSYYSFLTVLHDWCNKGRGIYYSVCGMVLITDSLLLIGYSSRGFHLSMSLWSLAISLTLYHRKQKCVK